MRQPTSCDYCEYKCNTTKGLRIHVSKKHKDKKAEFDTKYLTRDCVVCKTQFILLRGGQQGENWKCCSHKCGSKLASYGRSICISCGTAFEKINSVSKYCEICKRNPYARYGITIEEAKTMFQKNNGLCLLCDRKAKYIDHDHITGKIRGVLCPRCNTALGAVEIQGWTEKAHKYLKDGKCDI